MHRRRGSPNERYRERGGTLPRSPFCFRLSHGSFFHLRCGPRLLRLGRRLAFLGPARPQAPARGEPRPSPLDPAPGGGLPSPCAPAPEPFTREGWRFVKICAPACTAMRRGGGRVDTVWSGWWEVRVAGGLRPSGQGGGEAMGLSRMEDLGWILGPYGRPSPSRTKGAPLMRTGLHISPGLGGWKSDSGAGNRRKVIGATGCDPSPQAQKMTVSYAQRGILHKKLLPAYQLQNELQSATSWPQYTTDTQTRSIYQR
jgi:hypothetical protein